MAKMFYTLQETAEKLGVNEDAVREMASGGKLQQFRDRDKLMFKRDQVDNLAALSGTHAGGTAGDESSGPIPLADSDDTATLELPELDAAEEEEKQEKKKGGSGIVIGEGSSINVLEDESIELADSSALTNVPGGSDEQMVLESSGTGSGLLDLTRESDDTSLGAELLDEIYPAGESSDSKIESALGGSATFESAVAMGSTMGSGEATAVSEAESEAVVIVPGDPKWNGLAAGLLIGALASLVVGLLVVAGALGSGSATLTRMMSESMNSMLMYVGGLAVLTVIAGIIGMVVGKKAG